MRRPFLLIALSTVAVHAAAAQRLAKPVIDTVNHHIVRVMNSGPTAWTDTNGWKLVYERTVQPPDGQPGEFGNPTQVALLNDGRLIVSEFGIRAAAAVRLYGTDGRLVRTLGAVGEGPGEYRQVETGVFRDTLLIQDARLGRATIMTLDGKVVRTFQSSPHQQGEVAVTDDGELQTMSYGRDSKQQLVRFTTKGLRKDSVTVPEAGTPRVWEVAVNGGVSRYGIPFAGRNAHLYLADGSMVYGMTDKYQLVRSRKGADTALIFGRTGVTGRGIAPAVRDSNYRMAKDHFPDIARIASLTDIPSAYPILSALGADPSGNIWVTIGGNPGQPIQQFDVFGRDGRYLGAVAAPFRSATATSWSRDHLAILDTDENDLPRVRVYRIDRRGH